MSEGPARNDPCPCGSGKKYKKCCMRKEHAAPSAPRGPGDEELGYNPHAQRAILEVVENQLRDNDPPETRETLARLLREGHTEQQAKKLIAIIAAGEIYHVMKDQREFDQDGYIAALRRLPTLPDELGEDY